MNLHILERIPSEKIADVMRSTMLFLAIVITITLLGVVFFAAH